VFVTENLGYARNVRALRSSTESIADVCQRAQALSTRMAEYGSQQTALFIIYSPLRIISGVNQC